MAKIAGRINRQSGLFSSETPTGVTYKSDPHLTGTNAKRSGDCNRISTFIDIAIATTESLPNSFPSMGALRLVESKFYENGDDAFALYLNETKPDSTFKITWPLSSYTYASNFGTFFAEAASVCAANT